MPRSDHSLAKHLTAPLQVSETWDSSLLEILNHAYETENIHARRTHELLWSQQPRMRPGGLKKRNQISTKNIFFCSVELLWTFISFFSINDPSLVIFSFF
jgi:hypothetical protein